MGHTLSDTHVYTVLHSSRDVTTRGILTVVSSTFPVIPIIFLHSLLVRLGLVLAFTAVFASVLIFGLRVRPDIMLGITTAYGPPLLGWIMLILGQICCNTSDFCWRHS
jgi:hypothetical protein